MNNPTAISKTQLKKLKPKITKKKSKAEKLNKFSSKIKLNKAQGVKNEGGGKIKKGIETDGKIKTAKVKKIKKEAVKKVKKDKHSVKVV